MAGDRPSSTDSADATLLVVESVVTMFREPDRLTEQVSQALLGMPVLVLERRAEWARVRTPDTYEGWVQSSALVEAPEGWHAPWVEADDLLVNLRARNDSRLEAATRAPIGSRLPYLGQAENRTQVLLPDGRAVWTESHRVRAVGDRPLRAASPAAVCKTARRFLGVPYLWGGCSALGIDCSGFVQLVLRLHGIHALRDADQQFGQGEPVPHAATADLVFFGPVDKPDRITHVGMALDGVRFIHARGSDCVRVNRLDDATYAPLYRGARRFVPRRSG